MSIHNCTKYHISFKNFSKLARILLMFLMVYPSNNCLLDRVLIMPSKGGRFEPFFGCSYSLCDRKIPFTCFKWKSGPLLAKNWNVTFVIPRTTVRIIV